MAYVHFKNGEYDCYLYNAVSYASEPYIDVLGVMVWYDNKMISNKHCFGAANGLFPLAFSILAEETLDIKIQNAVFDNRDWLVLNTIFNLIFLWSLGWFWC